MKRYVAMAGALPKLMSHYRRALVDKSLSGTDVELEIRFRGVDFVIFETVLSALVSKKISVTGGAVTHSVNSITDERPIMRRPNQQVPELEGHQVNLIRQLTFESSSGKKIGERYYRKWSLAPPYRAHDPHTLDYIVALSAEETLSEPFSSNTSALIRVKSRASFVLPLDAKSWRIDLTITRTIRGSDVQTALSEIVRRMFRAGSMTPANMLSLLDIADTDSECRSLYTYEIEAEHLPAKVTKTGEISEPDGVTPSEIKTVADRILQLANPEHMQESMYQAEVYHVASFIVDAPGLLRRYEHEWGLKRLLPQVVALTRGEYKDFYPPRGYHLLDKTDGVRAVASVRDGRLLILADNLLKFYAPGYGPDPKGPKLTSEASRRVTLSTVVDGELVRTGSQTVFYAFDVIGLLGKNLTPSGYETRIGQLEDAISVLRDFGLDARPKPIVHLTGEDPDELKAQILSPAFAKRPYKTDGRILVEPGKPYRDTVSYKWKSLWDTTIDFLVRRAPHSVLGRRPYLDAPGHELHFLFVGINPALFNALGLEMVTGYQELFGRRAGGGSYFPIQFSPSDAPLAYCYQHPIKKPKADGWEGWTRTIDGKVVELRCIGAGEDCAPSGAPNWQLVRVREDRAREIKTQQYFGNDAHTAELTWLNYRDPFDEKQLWEGPTLGYFTAPKSAIYAPQTAFTSFVKSQRIESQLSHANWVVDAAIGKGQDLGRYIKAGVRHVVGIDLDQGALSELVRRKFSFARRTDDRRGQTRDPTTLFAIRADLTGPHDKLAEIVQKIVGFPRGGADGVVINLALHYLAGDVKNIRNFAALCRDLVKVGGTVVATCMFGDRVHRLLSTYKVQTGKSWDSRQNEVLKYSIRRDYAGTYLTSAGQKVGVLLPFSNGEYYEEYLVNIETITAEFKARGFAVVGTPTFDSVFDEFKTRNAAMFKLLTQGDFEFLKLFGEIILQREK